MREVRFTGEGVARWGRLDSDDQVTPLTGRGGEPDGAPRPLADLHLLAPVIPTKIVAVGRNYAAHARELGNEVPVDPLLFLKPPSALVGAGADIVLPAQSEEVHHEAELGVVIGTRVSGRVGENEALAAVYGLCCVNDVTARDIQRVEQKFTRAKGFDTFCPCGPWVTLGADPTTQRRITCRVDGEVRQDGHTGQMVTGVVDLIRFIASVMTLEPGDLIATGTPAGVGRLVAGQSVEVEIEGLGVLPNRAVGA